MDKRAFVTHPISLFLVAIIIGMILMILWAEGYINIPFPFGREVLP